MTDLRYVRKVGNLMAAHFSDGSQQLMPLVNSNQWKAGGFSSSNDPVPPDAPGVPEKTHDIFVTGKMVTAALTTAGADVSKALWTPDDIANMFNGAINDTAPGQFQTVARIAALVGECAVECAWFQSMREYQPPPGVGNYYGRGFIQLTWANNYKLFGHWMRVYADTGDDFLFYNNPDLLLTHQYAAYPAIYFFTEAFSSPTLAELADECRGIQTGDWHMISRGINRGNIYDPNPAYQEDLRNKIIMAVAGATDMNNTSNTDTSIASQRNKLRTWMLNHVGDYYYTQNLAIRNTQLTSGGGDCSSTFVLAYTDGLGMSRGDLGGDASTPGYTGTLGRAGTHVNDTGHESDGPMQVGDAVLYSWGGGGWPWDHVAMYIGNGQVASHGGPGRGPVVQALSMNVNYARKVEVRRYIG